MGGKNSKFEVNEPSQEAREILDYKKTFMQQMNISQVENGVVSQDFKLDKRAEPTEDDIQKIYKLKKVIGEGGTGDVKLASVRNDDSQEFAVKMIKKQGLSRDDEVYIINELSILRTVQHPNIVRYYESFQDNKYYYHVLEYCEGGSLFDFFSKGNRIGEISLIRCIFHQAVSATRYLHTHGICHRDIKLENFLIKRKGSSKPVVKLIDFGFSTSYRKAKMGTVVGTAQYMSPEVILDKNYGPECDNWSLGVMLYFMLFGSPPFSDNKMAMMSEMKSKSFKIPEGFEEKNGDLVRILSGLLEFNPTKRLKLDDLLLNRWIDPYYYCMIEEGINLLTTDLLMTLLIQNQKNRFRKILCCLFVKLFLDDPEIQKLSSIFVFMDLNEDGEITTEELQYFVQALLKQKISADELRQVCRSVSIEERDRITFLEFLVACASKEFFSNKSYRRIIFDRVDYEGEGFINSSKLMTCMDRLGVKYNPKNLEKAVKEYDMYKDGKITFYLFNTMFDKVDFPSSKQNDQDKFENFYGKLNKHYQDLGN